MEQQQLGLQISKGVHAPVVAYRSLESTMAEDAIKRLKSYTSELVMRTEMMKLSDSVLEELISQCEQSFVLSKKRNLVSIAKSVLKERHESKEVAPGLAIAIPVMDVSNIVANVKAEFLLFEKVKVIAGQQKCDISDYYYAIPPDLAVAIAEKTPWGISGGASFVTDDEILRYYILEASKSFFEADVLVVMIEKTLKKMLCLDVLPIPSVTTVYLFVVWSNMLAELTRKHYRYVGTSSVIVRLSISLLAMMIQIINRETPLAYVKLVYSAGIQAKDFVARMPQDIKVWVKGVLGNNTSLFGQTLDKALNNRFITWNNVLEELTNTKDLSMGKTIDMLYTYRIGNSFVEYAKSGKMFDVFGLSKIWKEYGPLPDGKQMDGMFELFRNIPGEYDRKLKAVYDNHVCYIRNCSSYHEIIQQCWKVYKVVNWLNLSYSPTSYDMTVLFEPIPRINYQLISNIVNWAENTNTSNALHEIRKEDVLRYVNDNKNQLFVGL